MNMTTVTRRKLITALLGICSMTIGFLLLPSGAGSQAAPNAAGRGSSANFLGRHAISPTSIQHSSTGTVTGPRMWDPIHQRLFSFHSKVTVDQTANLVDESIQVSWSGFTPSSQPLYTTLATAYPVMVAECNTPTPTSLKQCYGANQGGVANAVGLYGPYNAAYATTTSNGSGFLNMALLTGAADANPFLGCSATHECSVVVVPAQGGNGANCSDHSLDATGNASAQFDFNDQQPGPCSWAKRIVVPLKFAPQPSTCGVTNPVFSALGSPMLARAMNLWRAGLCSGAHSLDFSYNPAVTEPTAISELPLGLGDVALTTRPGPATIGNKTYTYAPLAISAVAIAYWIDNPATGQPFTDLNLNQRLAAKLITTSYDWENEGCVQGVPPPKVGCDKGIENNPFSLFSDPEYVKLNPKAPVMIGTLGNSYQAPTVLQGNSDMTWETTRWIAANAAASSFIQGHKDPWGMHVNTYYKGISYPTEGFVGQDPFGFMQQLYAPVSPLYRVVQYQVANTPTGRNWPIDPSTGNYDPLPPEPLGQRGLFAIMDEADAAAYRLPVAKLPNAKGHYVAPTLNAMAAALPSMVTAGNHVTQDVNYAKQSAAAYPLTVIIYALVPTSGVSKSKADAIARFLEYVAGPGQHSGNLPGQLAPGYLPLPAKLRAETLNAAKQVRAQAGKKSSSGHGGNPSSSPNPSTSSQSTPSSSSTATPSPRTSNSGPGSSTSPVPGTSIAVVALRGAQTAGIARYVLPVLLLVGGLATLAGASSLVGGTAGEAALARLRRLRRIWTRFGWRRS